MRAAHLLPLLLLVALVATAPAARAQGYDAWIASFGLTGADADAAADPDNDGVPNLVEYALDGYTPNLSDNAPIHTFVFGARTSTGLPFLDPSVITYGPGRPASGPYHIGLRYRPRAGTSGIMIVPEYTSDLVSARWYSGRGAFVVASDVPIVNDRVAWLLTQFQQSTPLNRWFLRLRVYRQ